MWQGSGTGEENDRLHTIFLPSLPLSTGTDTLAPSTDPPGAVMSDLKEHILEIARSHANTAKAAYSSRDREVELLKAEITLLEEKLRRSRAEVIDLRSALRKL